MRIGSRLRLFRYTSVFEIRHHLTPEGKDTVLEWQCSFRDSKTRVFAITGFVAMVLSRDPIGKARNKAKGRDQVWICADSADCLGSIGM